MSRVLSSSLAVFSLLFACAASPPKRPGVDEAAMRDAIRASEASGEDYASSSSYTHFLRSRLLHFDGEHRQSMDELRLALVTDEGNPFLLTTLAEEYARTGDLARAERTLRKVIERRPRYHPAQLLMGRVLTEGRKLARARVHLKRAIQLSPRDPDAYLALAQVEMESGRSEEAIAAVESMARAIPDESRGFRVLGNAFVERGDGPRAERMYSRAVEVFPGDYEAWSMLAQIRETTGRFIEAEAAYAEALQRDPDNVELLLSAGRVSLKINAENRANAWFERILSLTDDAETAVRVSFAYLSEDRVKSAADVLDRVRRRNAAEPRLSFYSGLMHEKVRDFARAAEAYGAVPSSSDLYAESRVRRAGALSLSGQHQKAADAFRRIIEERPEFVPAHTQFARALERAGAHREGERVLRAAVTKFDSPELFEALSTNLQRQGRAQDAVALLEDAAAKRPQDVALRFLLGAAYEHAGNLDKCLALMRTILSENPDNAAALNFVGYVLADHGRDFDEAERLVKRALRIKPDSGAFLDSLGWVYFRRGEVSRALEYLEKAAQLEPDEPVIIEHLGDAYAKADRRSDALRAYKRALEALNGGDEPVGARKLRQQLERKVKALSTESAVR